MEVTKQGIGENEDTLILRQVDFPEFVSMLTSDVCASTGVKRL
jgi:hypothetical protein